MKLKNFFENIEFVEITHKHIIQTLNIMLKNTQPFSILVNIANVSFEPELEKNITNNFQPVTMFILDGYTLSSAKVENNMLLFEAGFGVENFGSYVNVPIESILQIAVDETPVLVNMSLATKKVKKETKTDKAQGIKRSMSVLLSNPKNKDLFKK